MVEDCNQNCHHHSLRARACVAFRVVFMVCVALKLFSWHVYVTFQVSFMACVTLKLVSAAFCTKVRFHGV